MNNNKAAKWQHRIEETFYGKSKIVGERLIELKLIEDRLAKKLINRVSRYVCLMDAFLDFYIETLQSVATREATEWTEIKAALTGIHIPTFWRFRASYTIFWDGYFIDSTSLLRAIFENVLQIAALESGIVSIDEAFGKLKIEESRNLTEEEIYKLIRKYTRKADEKVHTQIIGEKSGLSSVARDDLKVFERLLHSTVHKSKFDILWHYGRWVRGERQFPLYPRYDEDRASLYINFSMFLGWMITRTFILLQLNDKEFSDSWHNKYQILNVSFQEAVEDFPKRLGRSIEELITRKFDFGY